MKRMKGWHRLVAGVVLLVGLASCRTESSSGISGPLSHDEVARSGQFNSGASERSMHWDVNASTVTTTSGQTVAAPRSTVELLERTARRQAELTSKVDAQLADSSLRARLLRELEGKRVLRVARGDGKGTYTVDAARIRDVILSRGSAGPVRTASAAFNMRLQEATSAQRPESGLDDVTTGPLRAFGWTMADCVAFNAASIAFYVAAQDKYDQLQSAINDALANDQVIDSTEQAAIDALESDYNSLMGVAYGFALAALGCWTSLMGGPGGGGDPGGGPNRHYEWVDISWNGDSWYSGWAWICEYAQ
jgi:hypothetical protein